jgi:lipoprotein-releasing system ATP-binding protein
MIEGKNLKKSYGNLVVLNNVSITVKEQEIVTIVGPSGAGKSTLLQLLSTLDKPDDGEVFFNGKPIHNLKGSEVSKFRNMHIGFIFQFHHLLPEFTALENVCMPAFINGWNKKRAEERANMLLQKLGLENRREHKPNELSGGEQQRVAVARALMNDPELIFADEPSGNLDTENASMLHSLFLELRETFKKTFIIVTHNPQLAAMGDRVIEMKDGEIII